MTTITRPDYDKRHAELREAERLAEDAYTSACFALETGTGSDGEVEKARKHRDTIKDRLNGLTVAFNESEKQSVQQATRADAEQRKKAVEEVEKLVEQRGQALRDLFSALEGIGKFARQYDDLSTEIRSKLSPFRTLMGRGGEEFGDLGYTLGERHRETHLVQGALFGEGLWGIGHRDAWTQLQDGGLANLIDGHGREISNRAERILPQEEEVV